MEKAQKPYKNRVFKGGHPKLWKIKKMDFKQKLPDNICVRKGEKRVFSCTLSVFANFFLDQNSVKQEAL